MRPKAEQLRPRSTSSVARLSNTKHGWYYFDREQEGRMSPILPASPQVIALAIRMGYRTVAMSDGTVLASV